MRGSHFGAFVVGAVVGAVGYAFYMKRKSG